LKQELGPSAHETNTICERRKWVAEEDEQLLALVGKYGTKNWKLISSHLHGRLPKQCRERWINHVDPSIEKERLAESDWPMVYEAQREYGNRWSEIAKVLPGHRTPNQIKNFWHATMRKKSGPPKLQIGEEVDCVDESELSIDDSTVELATVVVDPQQYSFRTLEQKRMEFEHLCEIAEIVYQMECDRSDEQDSKMSSPDFKDTEMTSSVLHVYPPLEGCSASSAMDTCDTPKTKVDTSPHYQEQRKKFLRLA
jgi:hypothetical protein